MKYYIRNENTKMLIIKRCSKLLKWNHKSMTKKLYSISFQLVNKSLVCYLNSFNTFKGIESCFEKTKLYKSRQSVMHPSWCLNKIFQFLKNNTIVLILTNILPMSLKFRKDLLLCPCWCFIMISSTLSILQKKSPFLFFLRAAKRLKNSYAFLMAHGVIGFIQKPL